VLEEVVDIGQSGASLERLGIDLVWDLMTTSEVSAALTKDRDCFGREPYYQYLSK
jgi:hypothetical protein